MGLHFRTQNVTGDCLKEDKESKTEFETGCRERREGTRGRAKDMESGIVIFV